MVQILKKHSWEIGKLVIVGLFYAGFTYSALVSKIEANTDDIKELQRLSPNKENIQIQLDNISQRFNEQDKKLDLILKIIEANNK